MPLYVLGFHHFEIPASGQSASGEDLSAAEYEDWAEIQVYVAHTELALSVFQIVTRDNCFETLRFKLREDSIFDTHVFGTADYINRLTLALREVSNCYDVTTAICQLSDSRLDPEKAGKMRSIFRAYILGGVQVQAGYPVVGWCEDGRNVGKKQAEVISGMQSFSQGRGPAWDWIRERL